MVGKDENSEKTLQLFLKIGLDERTAKNTIANNKVTNNLTAVIHEVSLSFSIFYKMLLHVGIFNFFYFSVWYLRKFEGKYAHFFWW